MSPATRTRIALLGSHGRMGKHVTQLIEGEYSDRMVLALAAERGTDLEKILHADVVIDFSSAAAIAGLARHCISVSRTHWPAFVIGTTGFSAAESRDLEALAHHTPVFVASNFSTGVQALLHALASVAPLLKDWGYTPVVIDKHHQYKKDAPSGTALTILGVLNPTGPQQIQTHSVRAGEIVGEHQVTFYGASDEISIAHRASDRSVFARGALDVSLWLHSKRHTLTTPPKRIWNMQDYFSDTSKLVAQSPRASL